MSREQAASFKKHRDADDPVGNLTWFARLQQKALRVSPEALAHGDVEREFEFGDDEKILWRLMKLARKAMDLEHTAILPTDKLRGFLRGLVAADVVDIVDGAESKALIPAEVKRLKADLAGVILKKPEALKGRVYRPEIERPAPQSGTEAEAAAPAPIPGFDVAVPVAATVRPAAPRQTAPTLTGEDNLIKEQLERAHAAMRMQNHYEFLGVQVTVDDVGVRQAYVRLARDYHPDKLAGSLLASDPALQSKIEALFRRLADAQGAIATAELRAGYNRTIETLGSMPNTGADGKKIRRPQEAGNALRMADTFYKKKDFKQAEMHYQQAAKFDPEDPKILTGLAWCIYTNPDRPEAERLLDARKRLIDITHNYKLADAHYKLGLIYRKQQDEGGAQRQFSNAAKLDPAHTDAQREVRLTEMREKKVNDDKKAEGGIFGRLRK